MFYLPAQSRFVYYSEHFHSHFCGGQGDLNKYISERPYTLQWDCLFVCCEYKTMGQTASCNHTSLSPDGSVMTISRTNDGSIFTLQMTL